MPISKLSIKHGRNAVTIFGLMEVGVVYGLVTLEVSVSIS